MKLNWNDETATLYRARAWAANTFMSKVRSRRESLAFLSPIVAGTWAIGFSLIWRQFYEKTPAETLLLGRMFLAVGTFIGIALTFWQQKLNEKEVSLTEEAAWLTSEADRITFDDSARLFSLARPLNFDETAYDKLADANGNLDRFIDWYEPQCKAIPIPEKAALCAIALSLKWDIALRETAVKKYQTLALMVVCILSLLVLIALLTFAPIAIAVVFSIIIPASAQIYYYLMRAKQHSGALKISSETYETILQNAHLPQQQASMVLVIALARINDRRRRYGRVPESVSSKLQDSLERLMSDVAPQLVLMFSTDTR